MLYSANVTGCGFGCGAANVYHHNRIRNTAGVHNDTEDTMHSLSSRQILATLAALIALAPTACSSGNHSVLPRSQTAQISHAAVQSGVYRTTAAGVREYSGKVLLQVENHKFSGTITHLAVDSSGHFWIEGSPLHIEAVPGNNTFWVNVGNTNTTKL